MIIKPQPKQEELLTCEADIALYGGSAGGGKSFSLLLCPLYHICNAKFNAVFFRRSIVQIRNQGGLWDESLGLYPHAQGHPRQQFLDWTFPSGAVIKFAHLENDVTVYNWQGSQINLLIFDELTHFTEHQFFYLLSRNRSVSGIKPYVRMSTNPDKTSWVRKFIDWWIGEDGFPIPERSGIIRYFIRKSGEIYWADTAEELHQYFTHDELESGATPRSFTFISSKLSDNQILMRKDPGYLSNLLAQNMVEKAKLLDGNWDIDYSDFGSILSRNDFKRFEYRINHKSEQIFPMFEKTYFVIDAAAKVKEANDYSVIGYFGKCRHDNNYYIIDWFRGKLEAQELEQKAIDMWHKWKLRLQPQGIWIEDASVGIVLISNIRRKGIPVFTLRAIKDKFLRLNDSLGIIKSGYVHLPDNANWVDSFFEECESFRADLKHVVMSGEVLGHDDQVDVLAYGLGDQITMQTKVGVYKKPEPKRKHNAIWMS